MTSELRIALAQLNPTIGDIVGNAGLARKAYAEAAAEGADLVLFSELFLSGYPPEDLVLKPDFQAACARELAALAKHISDRGPALLIGCPMIEGSKLYNGCFLLQGGKIAQKRFKCELPNYGVFDEKRVFSPGPIPEPIEFKGIRLGVPICEDIWYPKICASLARSGAEIMLVPNGSPFELGKHDVRMALALDRQSETKLPLIYVNQVGGQDELVFDGSSFATNADGSLACLLPSFQESLTITTWRKSEGAWRCEGAPIAPLRTRSDELYQAMMLGLKDYVQKNRFPGVVIGLSGGIDSALTASVAVDALGAENVWAIMMPSPYTSEESLQDAESIADNLEIEYKIISIEPAMQAFSEMLAADFADKKTGVAEENIQSRARGMTLMALSNKFGPMVLTTGNKSEMSVGYATLYGDMCGGFSVLKDIYKTMVFELARWRNDHFPEGALGPRGPVIPERVIHRPPSAELRPNQKDQDTLPPYPLLDGILECLVEGEMPVDDIVAKGYDREMVMRVWRMLDNAEYKRRQAPPGIKITGRAFGRDRRYPITNGFKKEG